jgi:hypothetical protein
MWIKSQQFRDTGNSSSLTFVPMDLVLSGALIAHRRFDWAGDWDRDSGRTLAACRNVHGNGPNGAVFLAYGGESSSYPFSNARLLSE